MVVIPPPLVAGLIVIKKPPEVDSGGMRFTKRCAFYSYEI